MKNPVIGAVIAFVLGAAISFLNYKLSGYFLKTKPEKFSSVSFIRQAVQVLYIVLLFFAAKYTPWDRTYLLIGGALGITLPMFFFTFRLLGENKKNTSDIKEGKEDSDG